MAKSWVVDLWVKDAVVEMPDGTRSKASPTGAQLKAIKTLPPQFRTSKWMTGKRWRTAWHEESNGREVQRAKLFATKAEAEAFAAELEDDIRMGRYLDPSARERPFGEIATEWISSKKKVKEATLIRYQESLRFYVLPKWGTVPIGQITRQRVDTWVAELMHGKAPNGFTRKKKASKLSPSSVRHIVRVHFGSVIRYALATRVISIDPLEGVELPRDAKSEVEEMRVLSHEDIDALATEAALVSGRESDKVLIHLLAYCGPRINEALAYQVGDVDLDQRRATIRRTWTRAEGGRKLGPPKTWEQRAIPLSEFLIPELQKLMAGRKPSDYLFRDTKGEALEYGEWHRTVWSKAAPAAGVHESFTIHSLRHTAASIAITSGADVMVVQQMLGHKDATETLNTYSHLWPNRLDEVMDAVSKHRTQALADASGIEGEQAA